MQHTVWVTEVRTLGLQIDAGDRDEAERLVRRAANAGPDAAWSRDAMLVRLAPSLDRHELVTPGTCIHRAGCTTSPRPAQLLGIGRTTLYALIKSGELETVTVGRRRFVADEQVSAFISQAAR